VFKYFIIKWAHRNIPSAAVVSCSASSPILDSFGRSRWLCSICKFRVKYNVISCEVERAMLSCCWLGIAAANEPNPISLGFQGISLANENLKIVKFKKLVNR
jgi:hypothetical protein